MPKLNLGRVVGRDGGFGNTDTVYINDGGAPCVTVEASGEDTAKDFVFTFKNLVRDVATADEVEQIAAGEIVQSSNVITAGVMSSIWAKIKGAFATKSHTHDASDITAGELAAILIANGLIDTDMLAAGAVTTTKIADGAVTNAKLDQTLRDSLSQLTLGGNISSARLGFGDGNFYMRLYMADNDYVELFENASTHELRHVVDGKSTVLRRI